MRILPEDNTLVRWFRRSDGLKLSELEEVTELSEDDYVLITDTSEKKSVKVKLSTLKKFIKS